MFKDLFVLEKERTGKEAFGFYLAYLLLSFLLGGLAGVLVTDFSASFAENFELGMTAGGYSAIIFCLVLSFAILFKKKNLQNFGLVLLAILSGIGAVFLGSVFGLIPIAYLTTTKKNN